MKTTLKLLLIAFIALFITQGCNTVTEEVNASTDSTKTVEKQKDSLIVIKGDSITADTTKVTLIKK